MIFYFSGCGNSRYVARTLAQWLNDTLFFIPEAAREAVTTTPWRKTKSWGLFSPYIPGRHHVWCSIM